MSCVVFVCDAGVDIGIGHVMRCLGLAEELQSRGFGCVFVADLDAVGWARAQVAARGFSIRPPGGATSILALVPSVVVIDSYTLPATVSAELRAAGIPVLAIIDGDTRGQSGDLYVDQNLGARPVPAPNGRPGLAGLDYVLLRDAVLRHRHSAMPAQPDRLAPRVLAYFGGTDTAGAAPVMASMLVATGVAFDLTVIAANRTLARQVRQTCLASRQILSVIGSTGKLPTLASGADLVMCAAGTSLWEMLCIGAAVTAIRVAGNQDAAYRHAVATGAIAGLGHIDDIRRDPTEAVAVATGLLVDESARGRLRAAGRALVDGRGRVRVVDALVALLPTPVVI